MPERDKRMFMRFDPAQAAILPDETQVSAMKDLLRRYGATLTGAFVLLTAFWLLALVILPNSRCSRLRSGRI